MEHTSADVIVLFIVILTNIALDLLGVGITGTLAYELKQLQVTQGRRRSFENTPMNRARVSSYQLSILGLNEGLSVWYR